MELLRNVPDFVLMAVLAAAVVSCVVMGLTKARRSRWLAGLAHEKGRRFFRDDPYDIPRRYAGFALISCGHSPRANNVTDARLGGRPARTFDFRAELGHGARRQTRYFCVAVTEAPAVGGEVLLWHDGDREFAPLAARLSMGRVGPWSYRGPRSLAAGVISACEASEDEPVCVEVREDTVMIAAPAGGRRSGGEGGFAQLAAVLSALREVGGGVVAGSDQT